MKTSLTTQIEESLYYYARENGAVVVEEVTMPEEQGIVDTLSCRLDNQQHFEWRCYELKVSKADFRSKAKLSFIGHYNYFVLPESLYAIVKEEIPAQIGALVYHPYLTDDLGVPGFFTTEKKPQRQTLQVNEQELLYRLITSQAREVSKAKQTARGLRVFGTKQIYQELKKRQPEYDLFGGGVNYYDRFIEETQKQTVEALKEELEATRTAYFQLEQQFLKESE
ncbi:hypothetical protein LQF61_00310 [Tetragenococcus koreensis]|uniref:Uncharacterized protein n=1 Tax=Tetragenococcus koreensis TaxID=290335 RepID=A0AAN4RLS8_9ENTE|nr:hypothetical protein [Tetragenococcus koreensis]MCF1584374.1 hypothetical protein [Tetragenococcus koreensis]MCF1613923.1 hypothetical protein [Tetragenococcus koreensis]MCF1616114.1 hypothetical protein [Tetragenococcus koreensis]MCF1618534.1 hypothetical protein [Tetragenococcus koreensis]MCF1621179.1 hypothetical protein [Tetragenococcus koreensis]